MIQTDSCPGDGDAVAARDREEVAAETTGLPDVTLVLVQLVWLVSGPERLEEDVAIVSPSDVDVDRAASLVVDVACTTQ
jgi:hypothetical protein